MRKRIWIRISVIFVFVGNICLFIFFYQPSKLPQAVNTSSASLVIIQQDDFAVNRSTSISDANESIISTTGLNEQTINKYQSIRNENESIGSRKESVIPIVTTMESMNNTDESSLVSNTYNGVDCSLYLIKNVEPSYEEYHVFHDWQCLISAFHFQLESNISVADCNNITFIVSQEYDYTPSVFYNSNIFNFKVISNKEFREYIRKPGNRYGCLKANKWQKRMVQLRDFIIKKFKMSNEHNLPYDSSEYYINYGDIVILDRARYSQRGIYNVMELKNSLDELFINTMHNVRLVYFENVTLLKQYETILNSSVIITPHGATETSLFMIGKSMRKYIKIIELCPPYTHCKFKCKKGENCWRLSRLTLCPHFYREVFNYLHIYGIAREDINLGDCYKYFGDHEWFIKYNLGSRDYVKDFKRVVNFKVNVDDIINIINQSSEIKEYYLYYHHRDFIHSTHFGQTELEFYKSNITIIPPGKPHCFDLYPPSPNSSHH